MNFVELPPELNLASVEHENFYASVEVHLFAGSEKEKVVRGGPIVYGLTIPKCSEHPREAIEFLKYLLGGEGLAVFERLGQPPLKPPRGYGAVPRELKGVVKVEG